MTKTKRTIRIDPPSRLCPLRYSDRLATDGTLATQVVFSDWITDLICRQARDRGITPCEYIERAAIDLAGYRTNACTPKEYARLKEAMKEEYEKRTS
jgi:hypothetical protein